MRKSVSFVARSPVVYLGGEQYTFWRDEAGKVWSQPQRAFHFNVKEINIKNANFNL